MQGLWLSSRPDSAASRSRPPSRWPSAFPTSSRRSSSATRFCCAAKWRAPELAAHHPRGQGAGADAGHLCGCLGILAAQPRGRGRGRFRHHPYPAVLGGLPDPGQDAARACRGDPPARWPRRFPGKEIFLGEFGWPSAGRMREGALPSPVNQARMMHEVLALGQARELPRQPDRGLRPALEAPARRHRRRPLGAATTPTGGRPNSPGARRCPTIRTGAGRRPAGSALPR